MRNMNCWRRLLWTTYWQLVTAFRITGIFCHQIFESGVVVEMLRTGYLLMWRSDQPSPAQPGGKSLIIQDLRHLYQYSTKYVAHIPSRQCTFLKGYLVQTYSRFVYIYPSSAGVSILKDIGCIHTRNMHQYTLLWECIHMKDVWYKLTRNMHTHILIVYFIEL